MTRSKLSAAMALAGRLALAATIILIPFRMRLILLSRPDPPLYRDYTDFLLFAADIALLCTLAFWLISLSLAPRGVTLGPRHIWMPLAVLTLAGWASVASSYDSALSVYQAVRLSALFWFYVFIVNEIGSAAWIVIPAGVQIALQSVVALAQFIAQRSVDLQGIGELGLNPAWQGISIVVANGVRLLRAYGLSDHPNILGGCLAFGMLLLLAVFLDSSGRSAVAAAFVPASAALLVTFSRSAWIAFAAGALMIAGREVLHRRWASFKQLWSLVSICLVLLAAFFLAYAGFFGVRLNAGNSFSSPSVEQQSIGERTLLINDAAPLLREHPVFGVGLGASPRALQLLYPVFPVDYQPPHWTLFDSALETGIFGGAAYLVLMISPFVVWFRRRQSLSADRFASAALAVLLALALIGFFDYYTWLVTAGRLWQWLAWGSWAVALGKTGYGAGLLGG